MNDSPENAEGAERQPGSVRSISGLSGKVLVLTIFFVMLAEVLIYVPSVANFRINWLKERLSAAQIASLVLEATPDNMVSESLTRELLANAGAKAIALKRANTRKLMLRNEDDLVVELHFDLRDGNWMMRIMDAFEALAAGGNRLIHVTDMARHEGGDTIDIVIEEAPLRAAMVGYSINIMTLSIAISIIAATLVFLALNWTLVRPMHRLTVNMVRFGESPEDPERIITPGQRRDEIGVAERELARMQMDLAATLHQKSHLAALGLAVSKISHDLRNMLTSTQLLSDRLGMVNDPTVKRVAPKLLSTLDRAIDFCEHTLKFGKAQEQPPRRDRFKLNGLAGEVIETAGAVAGDQVVWRNRVPRGLIVDADRGQLYRVLLNLARNAAEALVAADRRGAPGEIEIRARREASKVVVEVQDNGPGVPEAVRDHMFEPFRGSGRVGSTGLGLAIAAELVRAHQGEISLVDGDPGTMFRFTIPDRLAEVLAEPSAEESRSAG